MFVAECFWGTMKTSSCLDQISTLHEFGAWLFTKTSYSNHFSGWLFKHCLLFHVHHYCENDEKQWYCGVEGCCNNQSNNEINTKLQQCRQNFMKPIPPFFMTAFSLLLDWGHSLIFKLGAIPTSILVFSHPSFTLTCTFNELIPLSFKVTLLILFRSYLLLCRHFSQLWAELTPNDGTCQCYFFLRQTAILLLQSPCLEVVSVLNVRWLKLTIF